MTRMTPMHARLLPLLLSFSLVGACLEATPGEVPGESGSESPGAPTDPGDPSDPGAPSDPGDPSDPSDPSVPDNPGDPGAPDAPDEPVELDPWVPSPLCPALDLQADEPMMVSLYELTASIFDGSGVATSISSKVTEGIPAGAVHYRSEASPAAGWLVVRMAWLLNLADGQQSGTTLTALTNAGEVIWTLTLEGTQWRALPRDDGHTLVIAEGIGAHLWVAPDGSHTASPIAGKPMGPLVGDHVWTQFYPGEVDDGYPQCWANVLTGDAVACAAEVPSPRVVGGTAYTLVNDESGLHVLSVPPTYMTQTPVEGAPDEPLFLVQVTASGWAIAASADLSQRYRLHLPTAALTPIAPTLPAGWSLMAPCHGDTPQVGVSDDGSVTIGLLDEAFASALFAWEPETDTLDQLTPAVPGVGSAYFHHGTRGYRAELQAWYAYYCWQPTGDAADIDWDGVAGNLTLYANNAETALVTHESWAYSKADPTGLCVLHEDGDTPDGFVEVIDMSTGEWTGQLPGVGSPTWLRPGGS